VAAVLELLRHGETGWLVPAEDPAALVEAIVFLAANPEQRLDIGRAGLARVTGSFDHDAGLSVIRERLGLSDPPADPVSRTLDAAQ
jgi:glycosyltransferase involved in cell wall biosynthesis